MERDKFIKHSTQVVCLCQNARTVRLSLICEHGPYSAFLSFRCLRWAITEDDWNVSG